MQENIKPRDLYETYLPPFEALVKEGKVEEVCALTTVLKVIPAVEVIAC